MLSEAAKVSIRLILALILGLAAIGFLPVPAQAQEPIDLELAGGGATSWDIANIKPGDSGTQTVELRNVGSEDGEVTIWISDIEEVDGGSDGAVLDDYVLFNLSCQRLSTNVTLPATIHQLPQSAADTNYIRINTLFSGETLILVWEWGFAETGGPQNDSQEDSFSFTINYLLEELPPPGGGGGGWTPSHQQLEIDIMGEITVAEVNSWGILLNAFVASDPNNEYGLEFSQGTRVTCANGGVPSRIEMRLCEEPPPPADGMEMVGPAYYITGYIGDPAPYSLFFDKPVELTLSYDTDWLSTDTTSIVVAYYEAGDGWIGLEPVYGGVAQSDRITVLITHTSIFAIFAETVPSTPSAQFELGELDINPAQAEIGEPVTISTIVQNTGQLEGSYTLTLRIDGEIEQSRVITLAAGERRQLSFTVSKDASGTYAVDVNGLTGEFIVLAPEPSLAPASSPPWLSVYWWVILLIAGTTASLVYFLLVRRRHQP